MHSIMQHIYKDIYYIKVNYTTYKTYYLYKFNNYIISFLTKEIYMRKTASKTICRSLVVMFN